MGYRSGAALRHALGRFPARIVRRLPQLHAVEVRPHGNLRRFAEAVSSAPGIRYVERLASRDAEVEPALTAAAASSGAYEWQFAAAREDQVPPSVAAAAASITIGVVDTGADATAPDIAAKSPTTWSVVSASPDVTDTNGHGTFVSSLAAGSATNGEGIAGFGGAAKLLVVQAAQPDGTLTDVDEANAIVYAVDHGAKIINLSFGGPSTTTTEQSAVDYAVSRGVLLVAAAGNSALNGNPTFYPAALLQPVGSNGQGGGGLAVGASNESGSRASFSETGSFVSLAAPGENVLGAISSSADPANWPTTAVPGSSAGLYGFGSGTSFATPEVAGAAALVWAANPLLRASDVATILKNTASGHGTWNPELGWGVIDVAAAVAQAQGATAVPSQVALNGSLAGTKLHLVWSAPGSVSYRVDVTQDGGAQRVLFGATTSTSADIDLLLDHRYTFTVTATDPYGRAITSAPYDVSLVRAASTVALRATSTRGKGRPRLTFSAQLRAGAGPAVAGRPLLLESVNAGGAHLLARLTTDAHGNAVKTVRLRRGVYRVRARFAGALDLRDAVSRIVTVRVRR